jgi:hypothetical protein
MVDRSLATVRRWVAGGEIEAHYGPGTHSSNRPVLVSRAALQLLAGTSKSAAPGRAPPVAPVSPVAVDPAELLTARAERDLARVELLGVHDLVDALRLVIRGKDERLADLAGDVEAERARVAGLAAELEAVRGAAGLPWWRRLLGVSMTTPRLPSDGEA